jgi:hypothetical protein
MRYDARTLFFPEGLDFSFLTSMQIDLLDQQIDPLPSPRVVVLHILRRFELLFFTSLSAAASGCL